MPPAARASTISRTRTTRGLDELVTEAGSRPEADYDLRATLELVELMNAEDADGSRGSRRRGNVDRGRRRRDLGLPRAAAAA